MRVLSQKNSVLFQLDFNCGNCCGGKHGSALHLGGFHVEYGGVEVGDVRHGVFCHIVHGHLLDLFLAQVKIQFHLVVHIGVDCVDIYGLAGSGCGCIDDTGGGEIQRLFTNVLAEQAHHATNRLQIRGLGGDGNGCAEHYGNGCDGGLFFFDCAVVFL